MSFLDAGVHTPNDVVVIAEQMALKKSKAPFRKLVVLSILAGAYISMGGLLSLVLGYGFPGVAEAAPSLSKLLSGFFFPLALILIVLVGGELFTGNAAYLVVGARQKVIPWSYIPYNWTIVYIGNFIGAFLFAYLFVYLTDLIVADPWRSAIIGIGESKTSLPWGVAFLKGIVANWLVCLALWLGFSSKEMIGRVVGIIIPVMTFVALGYEHSIANMFYIPMAYMMGADFTIWEAIWNNFIPVTIGNVIGGGLFVGATYSWIYGKKKKVEK